MLLGTVSKRYHLSIDLSTYAERLQLNAKTYFIIFITTIFYRFVTRNIKITIRILDIIVLSFI
jgi:hypothetical protein